MYRLVHKKIKFRIKNESIVWINGGEKYQSNLEKEDVRYRVENTLSTFILDCDHKKKYIYQLYIIIFTQILYDQF